MDEPHDTRTSSKAYLVLFNDNPDKKQNFGKILRSAAAFQIHEVLIVGSSKFSTHGAHGSVKHLDIRYFESLDTLTSYLRQQKCDICGIEITDTAQAVDTHSFERRSVAFVVANEKNRLKPDQRAICDYFVHVPVFRRRCGNPVQALDTTVCVSIVLHHFCWSSAMPERAFTSSSTQGKFVVADVTYRGRTSEQDQVAAKRQEARVSLASSSVLESGDWGGLFGD